MPQETWWSEASEQLLAGPSQGLSPRMWSLVPLWLALSGAVTSLRCPDGRLCQGLDVCCQDPGGDDYACCPPSLVSVYVTSLARAGGVAMGGEGLSEPAALACVE